MDWNLLLESALEALFQDASGPGGDATGAGIVPAVVYAGAYLGGGEIGLYTLLAGYVRRRIADLRLEHRLWLNGSFQGDGHLKPDFQIYTGRASDGPEYVAEVKLLHWNGQASASPANMAVLVKEDVAKIARMRRRKPGLAAGMVLFHRSGGAGVEPFRATLGTLLGAPGLAAKVHAVRLWDPLGLAPGWLQAAVVAEPQGPAEGPAGADPAPEDAPEDPGVTP